MSSATSGVAVAVSASTGGRPERVDAPRRGRRYSGRKSWPHSRDAVRLVDHEQRHVGHRELVQHLRPRELLGREEDELQRVLGELGQRRSRSRRGSVEFSCAAPPAACSRSPSTWSRWSAISGETTTVAPGVSSPAIW